MSDNSGAGRTDGAVAVVRRAPFSVNPAVGARGRKTQQRILNGALRAFGEQGYRGCSIDRITKLARCSRVSFYQYFASKEDLFRQLARQVAREVNASTEELGVLTPDLEGWAALRTWVASYADIHERYEPIFHALETNEELEALAQQTGEQTIARVRAQLAATSVPPRQLEPFIRFLLECVNHVLDVAGILRAGAPEGYPRDRVEIAIADVVHRALFGLRPGVNVHAHAGPPLPVLVSSERMADLFRQSEESEVDSSANATLNALLASGFDVFIDRGFHNTRIDDLVAAAGVSHGAFYRYFPNKDELARMLTVRAVRDVGTAFAEIPDVSLLEGPAGTNRLRKWLRRYHAVHEREAVMLRVWIDAALQDPAIRAESAPLLDWGRRRMAHYLEPRGFGDDDMDAVVMIALIGVFGARQRSAPVVDAAALVIERGLLGRERA